jgi:hypothetical protein
MAGFSWLQQKGADNTPTKKTYCGVVVVVWFVVVEPLASVVEFVFVVLCVGVVTWASEPGVVVVVDWVVVDGTVVVVVVSSANTEVAMKAVANTPNAIIFFIVNIPLVNVTI